jgi:hypothetical protein
VLCEGFDCPVVSALILARPTKSLVLYRQMAGRILRTAPGKTDSLIFDHAGVVLNLGFPDEPVTWALRPDDRAAAPVQMARAQGQARALTTCPECRAVRVQGDACGACGWKPKKRGDDVETIDGELVPISRQTRKGGPAVVTPAERRQFFGELVSIGRDRGYKPGWPAAIFKEKFGEWPARGWDGDVRSPSEKTLSWVKSRMIRYAKGRRSAA